MIFNWYKIINRAEFLATGLTSREISVILDGLGAATILVTVGALFSLTYDGVMVSVNMSDENPFSFEGRGIFVDANDDVWLGFEVEA